LAKYGIALRHDCLNDTHRTVSTSLFGEPPEATLKTTAQTQKSRRAAGLQSVTGQTEKARF